MAGCERSREIRRRRKRKETYLAMQSKLAKASPSEKAEIARKLRLMTPGCELLIEKWELVKG